MVAVLTSMDVTGHTNVCPHMSAVFFTYESLEESREVMITDLKTLPDLYVHGIFMSGHMSRFLQFKSPMHRRIYIVCEDAVDWLRPCADSKKTCRRRTCHMFAHTSSGTCSVDLVHAEASFGLQ